MATVQLIVSSLIPVARDNVLPTVTVAPSFSGNYPLIISGNGTPGAVVTVENGLATQKAALVDADGNWSVEILATPGTNRTSTVTVSNRNGTGTSTTTNITVSGTVPDPIISVNGTVTSTPVTPSGVEQIGGWFDGSLISKGLGLAPSTSSPSSVTNPGGLVVEYALASGVATYATSYELTSANDDFGRDPKDWRLQGWNGSTWVTLDTQTNQQWTARTQTKFYTVTGNTNLVFTKYRFLIDQNDGSVESGTGHAGLIQLGEVVIRGVDTLVICTAPTINTVGTTSFSGVSGTANSFGSQVLPTANPATPSGTWSKFSGASWVTIGANGAASISAAAPVGTYTAVREYNNGCAPNLQQTLTFTISAAPCVAPTLTSAGTTSFSGTAGIGNAFSSQILPVVNSATAGTWTKTSGPAWVTIGANRSASITSAATAGTSTATATYSNGCAPDIVQTLTFTIANASVAPDVQGPLPTATEGQAYSAVLTTIGSPTAITVTSPSWLSAAYVSGNWVLSGTPPASAAGTIPTVSFSMTNAASSTPVVRTLPLQVNAATPTSLAIATPNNWSGVHAQINTFQHTATGGVPPYTWSISGQDAGVTINPSTGVVTLPASLP